LISPDFSARTVETLSRRAALRCSNPDCDKLTTGPNTEDTKATNIGEAAHIFGARPGAARYRAEMSDEERGAITNAIWLCSDCHGQVDKDPARFPDTLLFLWREKHAEKLLTEIGKPGELIRRLAADRELRVLGELPLYAEQIVREKPSHWEYMLTAELLEFYLKPVLRAARDLEKGLVVRPRHLLPYEEFSRWVSNKPNDLKIFADAMVGLLQEMQAAWGLSGEPGDPYAINHVCKLIGKAASHMVAAAEDAKFTDVPKGFEGVSSCLAEGALYPIRRLPELSAFIRTIYTTPTENGGSFRFILSIELPDGWAESFEREMKKGERALISRGGQW